MRISLLPLAVFIPLAGCGEAVKDDHFANDVRTERTEPAPVRPAAVPVRIGELGPSFNACNSAGTSRNLDPAAGDLLQVRAAPSDAAGETSAIPASARFFICTRSHDQRWLGIVFEESGALSPGCGVSRPVAARRPYEGPCLSGWVASAFVKQIAG